MNGGFSQDVQHAFVYQIRLQGHLSDPWNAWFEGFSVTREECGHTLLVGEVIDQPALYGLLRKVRDLGLPLLSVIRLEMDKEEKSFSDKEKGFSR
ncbi:MAG: hypothetical protein H6728_10605 [Myxococcales bacterium]|nr:hypothetical protein [Myxococcales bacterium]MCB9643509.1 hypothetical protein [Myxococcales bacterium]